MVHLHFILETGNTCGQLECSKQINSMLLFTGLHHHCIASVESSVCELSDDIGFTALAGDQSASHNSLASSCSSQVIVYESAPN
eukprot:scaffold72317_cov16-Prasinocladus_malaysianus.AAC.1